jgi:hypothetical protein
LAVAVTHWEVVVGVDVDDDVEADAVGLELHRLMPQELTVGPVEDAPVTAEPGGFFCAQPPTMSPPNPITAATTTE